MVGVCDTVLSKQMSQIGKEKKRKDQRDWWIPSLTSIFLNLQSIRVEHRGGSHRRAASQSFERLFSEALLLWPVERVNNKAASEKAGWLASGTLLLHVEGFTVHWKDEERQGTKTLPRRPSRERRRAGVSRCLVLLSGSAGPAADSDMCHRWFVIKWEKAV